MYLFAAVHIIIYIYCTFYYHQSTNTHTHHVFGIAGIDVLDV